MTKWEKGLSAKDFNNVRTVAFYKNDTNCDDRVLDRADNTTDAPIEELGRDLADMIFDNYTSDNRSVAISAHSMGGLVVRAALDGVARKKEHFPSRLLVTDVVTSGTPHAGSLLPGLCFLSQQCTEMLPDSDFLESLGHNPQGTGATDWTVVGSKDDWVVSESSATAMNRVSTDRPAVSKVVHDNLGHDQLITAPVALGRINTGLRTGL